MHTILFVMPDLKEGGAQKVVSIVLKHLSRNKFRIILALVKKEGGFLSEIPKDIEVIDLKSKRRRYALLSIAKLVNRINPDLVFSSLHSMNMIVHWAVKLSGKKPSVVFREATTLSEYIKNPIERKLLRTVYSNVDSIICLTERMLSDLADFLKYPAENSVIIPNPIESSESSNQLDKGIAKLIKPDNFNLVTTGRLVKSKGVDTLLDAFALFLTRYEDSMLFILGDGDEKANLIGQSISLGIQENVVFCGFVNNPSKYYRLFDVFVFPSLFEGLPNSLLEALGNGLPVIASDIPAVKDLLIPEVTGLSFQAGNSQDLYKTIAEFRSDNLKDLNKVKIKQTVAHLSCESVIARYEEHFLSLIKQSTNV